LRVSPEVIAAYLRPDICKLQSSFCLCAVACNILPSSQFQRVYAIKP